jgi:hypothetical protein
VEGRANVQAHVEGRNDIKGIEGGAVVEGDALAQGADPDRQVIVRGAGLSQDRFDRCAVDLIAIQRLHDLLAGAQ